MHKTKIPMSKIKVIMLVMPAQTVSYICWNSPSQDPKKQPRSHSQIC